MGTHTITITFEDSNRKIKDTMKMYEKIMIDIIRYLEEQGLNVIAGDIRLTPLSCMIEKEKNKDKIENTKT